MSTVFLSWLLFVGNMTCSLLIAAILWGIMQKKWPQRRLGIVDHDNHLQGCNFQC